jgi:hypothetical protein
MLLRYYLFQSGVNLDLNPVYLAQVFDEVSMCLASIFRTPFPALILGAASRPTLLQFKQAPGYHLFPLTADLTEQKWIRRPN